MQAYLVEHPEGQYVFYDYSCTPQRLLSSVAVSSGVHGHWATRTTCEQREFDLVLNNVLSVYLGFKVLILMDDLASVRFWPQLETFLALQSATRRGLAPTPYEDCRAHFMYFASTPEDEQSEYFEKWLRCTSAEAYQRLASAEVAVSFESDKQAILPKLLGLDDMVSQSIKTADGPKVHIPSSLTFGPTAISVPVSDVWCTRSNARTIAHCGLCVLRLPRRASRLRA